MGRQRSCLMAVLTLAGLLGCFTAAHAEVTRIPVVTDPLMGCDSACQMQRLRRTSRGIGHALTAKWTRLTRGGPSADDREWSAPEEKARRLQQEEVCTGVASRSPCCAGSFCNLDDGDSGFCELCPRAISECSDMGLPAAGARDCSDACLSANGNDPPYPSAPCVSVPQREPSTEQVSYQRFHCCNSTMYMSAHTAPGCPADSYTYSHTLAGLPGFDGSQFCQSAQANAEAEQGDDAAGNDLLFRCPASGTGDVEVVLFPAGSNCTGADSITITYPTCPSDEEEEEDDDDDSDDAPPACVASCEGLEELDDVQDAMVICGILRTFNASGCLASCPNDPEWEEIRMMLQMCGILPGEAAGDARDVCSSMSFQPGWPTSLGWPTAPAYCAANQTNLHWKTEWSAADNTTKGFFEVTEGCGCYTDGDCLYSDNFPDVHPNGAFCTARVHTDTTLTALFFNLESCCDKITVYPPGYFYSSPTGYYGRPTEGGYYDNTTGYYGSPPLRRLLDHDNTTAGSPTYDGWNGGNYGLEFSGCGMGLNDTVVVAGSTIQFYTDGSVQNGGFKVCTASAANSTEAGNLPKPSWSWCEERTDWTPTSYYPTYRTNCTNQDVNTHWEESWGMRNMSGSNITTDNGLEVIEGCGCWTDGTCVYSNNYPRTHNENEHCVVAVHTAGYMDVQAFSTERSFDQISLQGGDGREFGSFDGCGQGLHNMAVTARTVLAWTSDGSVSNGGFKICLASEPVANDTAATTDEWCDESGTGTTSDGVPCWAHSCSSEEEWYNYEYDEFMNYGCSPFDVNTHWTNVTAAGSTAQIDSHNAYFNVSDGCGCWTDGDCVYSRLYPLGQSGGDCTIMVERPLELSVVAYASGSSSLTLHRHLRSAVYGDTNNTEIQQFGDCRADGDSLQGATLAPGDFLQYMQGYSMTDGGFAICAAGSTREAAVEECAWCGSCGCPAADAVFEVTNGCGCVTDGQCVYSSNFFDGSRFNTSDACDVTVLANTTLAVMAYDTPPIVVGNTTQNPGGTSTWDYSTSITPDGVPHFILYDWMKPFHMTYIGGNGSALDGLELSSYSGLSWQTGWSRSDYETFNSHGSSHRGYAICNAANPDFGAVRDWSTPASAPASSPVSGNTVTDAPIREAAAVVMVTTTFAGLEMGAMADRDFRTSFLSAYKQSTAEAAGVTSAAVEVMDVRAGSVLVESRIILPDADDATQIMSAMEDPAVVYASLTTKFDVGEVAVVVEALPPPTAAPTAARTAPTAARTAPTPEPPPPTAREGDEYREDSLSLSVTADAAPTPVAVCSFALAAIVALAASMLLIV